MDGKKVYTTTLNNVMGAKTTLDGLMEEPTYQTPALRKAATMLNTSALQEQHNNQQTCSVPSV